MNTANLNQAVTGFGMALAAMGATQADAEIVSLSFGGSPAVLSCNAFCTVGNTVTASWVGGGSGQFKFSLRLNSVYSTFRAKRGTSVSALAFKYKGDVVSGGAALAASVNGAPSQFYSDQYIGFNTTGNLNGWLKVNFAGSPETAITITFIEGAIQTTAGTPINVGDVPLAPVPVPPMLPAMGLAVLALGAAGVRRSRKAA